MACRKDYPRKGRNVDSRVVWIKEESVEKISWPPIPHKDTEASSQRTLPDILMPHPLTLVRYQLVHPPCRPSNTSLSFAAAEMAEVCVL